MSVKVVDNTLALKTKTQQSAALSLRFMTDAIVSTSKPRTPQGDTRFLRQNVLKQVLGLHATVLWAVAYAQYQERGARKDGSHVVKNYSTSGTGAHFAETAVDKVVASAEQYFKEAQLI